jgi:hypothetical protein
MARACTSAVRKDDKWAPAFAGVVLRGEMARVPPINPGGNEMAFYELRQYHVRPGKMDEWVKIMEEEIIPFQVSKGMVISGSFRGETDDSKYVWIRRFENEAEREALYKAVYDTDYWKTKIAPRVPDCLDREKMVVTRIVPTSKSVLA